MSTLLEFTQSIADACAETPVTTVVNPATNAKFIRMALACVDDALAHLTTLHQWEWRVLRVVPTALTQNISDLIRVRDVFYNKQRLPYVAANTDTGSAPSFTLSSTSVTINNITVPQLTNVVITYESFIATVTPRADSTAMPVPLEYEYGLREYVMYLLHTRHVNDSKRAQTHLNNALSQYDMLKSREHSNRQTFNRYTGVNRR